MVLREPKESKACRNLCIHSKEALDPGDTKELKKEGHAFTKVTGVYSQETTRKYLLKVQVAHDSGCACGQMVLKDLRGRNDGYVRLGGHVCDLPGNGAWGEVGSWDWAEQALTVVLERLSLMRGRRQVGGWTEEQSSTAESTAGDRGCDWHGSLWEVKL